MNFKANDQARKIEFVKAINVHKFVWWKAICATHDDTNWILSFSQLFGTLSKFSYSCKSFANFFLLFFQPIKSTNETQIFSHFVSSFSNRRAFESKLNGFQLNKRTFSHQRRQTCQKQKWFYLKWFNYISMANGYQHPNKNREHLTYLTCRALPLWAFYIRIYHYYQFICRIYTIYSHPQTIKSQKIYEYIAFFCSFTQQCVRFSTHQKALMSSLCNQNYGANAFICIVNGFKFNSMKKKFVQKPLLNK